MQFNDSNSVYYFDFCDIPQPKKIEQNFINLPNIIRNTLQQKHAANCPAILHLWNGPCAMKTVALWLWTM